VATIAGLAVGLALAGGCGIPEDSKPQAAEQVSLPPQLIEPPSSTTPQPISEAEVRTVYLVRTATSPDASDTLQPVRTQVRNPPKASEVPRAVIEQLLRLPTAEQQSLGLRSDIPSSVQVLSASLDPGGDVLTVDLSNLGKVEGPKQRLAAAQIVFSATELPGIRAVRFETDGQPTTIPLEDRSSAVGQPITRDDFPKLKQALDGGPASTTTTAGAAVPVPLPVTPAP
jgi:spore germination protein GerM